MTDQITQQQINQTAGAACETFLGAGRPDLRPKDLGPEIEMGLVGVQAEGALYYAPATPPSRG